MKHFNVEHFCRLLFLVDMNYRCMEISSQPLFKTVQTFKNISGQDKMAINPSQNEITNNKNFESQYSTIRTDIGPPNSFKYHTKPPLAGPYAFSRIPKPRWENPRIHLKHGIENTWLFMNSFSSGYVKFDC